ncbi:MAG: hypothetical protein GY911_08720 [Actinomycetales bacterium]|nr:hypothetical protein [Actinomycetales bacterium]
MTESRLTSYARAAGGVAGLAAGGAANAEIITSIGSTQINLNEGYTDLFTIDDGGVGYGSGLTLRADNGLYLGSSVFAGVNLEFFAFGNEAWNMVDVGDSIGPGFTGGIKAFYFMSSYSGFSYAGGNLDLGAGNIVGFSATNTGAFGSPPGDSYYGWVAYDLARSGNRFHFEITSWAYNDVAGEGIIAGQNLAAGSSAVPGLGGLAALAIGAAGVRTRRQRTVA